MNRRVILFLIYFHSAALSAQGSYDSLRAYYIEEFPERFALWPVLKQRKLSFTVRERDGDKERINYNPNNAFSLGAGGILFDLLVEVTFAIPLNEKRTEIYGETKVRDFQANVLAKRFALDAYYQQYSGFYVDDKNDNIPPGQPFPQRDDIYSRNYGVNGIYVLNHRKFSLRSAFNYFDRQKTSRGSIIVGGLFNVFKIKADSAIIPGSVRPDFGQGSSLDALRNTTFSIGAGYSYTYIWKDFFANATASIGPAQNWISYEEQNVVKTQGLMNAITSLRFGLGYNSNRYFGGISYTTQTRGVTFDDVRFSSTSSMIRMVAGYRFIKVGILKKRAVDLIPSSL
jgi:hypothetical protein